ncbi:MAG: 30S ribosomal protein S19e [Candidatus Thermoplasmatota archaeon]|nr:30S ribosomal protein S19e [Candidatus Thermoplasmatota archaeon]
MTTPFDVGADLLIERLAEKLRSDENENIKPPEWAGYVKTGAQKEKLPARKDWWYIRSAAVLRKLYIKGPLGVERLRAEYGGAKRRGCRPQKATKGSGAIIREILQQLESAGVVSKVEKEGRALTPKGRALLDSVAYELRVESREVS